MPTSLYSPEHARASAGTPVTLRRDAIQPSRDRYGRLLRYVATGHLPDIGLTMIRSGWAGAYPYGSGNTREARYRRGIPSRELSSDDLQALIVD